MDQETRWLIRYKEVMEFIETNKRNPSRYDPTERELYSNWLHHNRKQMNSGTMKPERVELFKRLLALSEEYKRKNQYQ